MFADKF